MAIASNVIDLEEPDVKDGLYDNLVIQAVVDLSTSSKVTVRVEGNLDNNLDGNWANLDDAQVDTEISENGATLFTFDNTKQEIRYVRLYFASETGGTGATIVGTAKVN